MNKVLRIKSPDFFSKAEPFVAKLAPIAVEESIIGFTTRIDWADEEGTEPPQSFLTWNQFLEFAHGLLDCFAGGLT